MTPPRPLNHPIPLTAGAAIGRLEASLALDSPNVALERAMSRAGYLLERARKDGTPAAELRRLEDAYEALKGRAFNLQRSAMGRRETLNPFGGPPETYASARNLEMAIKALESGDHWASREIQRNLIDIVVGNSKIPESMKVQLCKDVARVLQICPHAGGLAKELTMRGQRGATGSMSKLGSAGNASIGSAYELMGTAALSHQVSRPVNAGAPALFIDPSRDNVVFGNKVYLDNRLVTPGARSTIECDTHLSKGGDPREVGIDFKHAKNGTTHSGAKLRDQMKNVAIALKENQLDEYHFVTNGKFGQGFLRDIAVVNAELVAYGRTPIGCHQYVSTLG